jgi:hypothetical protein
MVPTELHKIQQQNITNQKFCHSEWKTATSPLNHLSKQMGT